MLLRDHQILGLGKAAAGMDGWVIRGCAETDARVRMCCLVLMAGWVDCLVRWVEGADCTGLNGSGAVRAWFPLAGVMDGE